MVKGGLSAASRDDQSSSAASSGPGAGLSAARATSNGDLSATNGGPNAGNERGQWWRLKAARAPPLAAEAREAIHERSQWRPEQGQAVYFSANVYNHPLLSITVYNHE